MSCSINVMRGISKPAPELCSQFHHASELIGRRWTGAILRALLSGATRFSDIRGAIPHLSDRMLSERLKELEKEGIVRRTVIPETPVRIDYHLTPKGHALDAVIEAVSAWAHDWQMPPHEHAAEQVEHDDVRAGC